ncbi:hypothetical protein BU16DRAFT_563460 [Lophium mytilinum]|uniref:Uncharacterized protein n=1 Tax=Lophium mytilinum TaxID=390894 RepID=A0A6A6QR22_9PEZI|nr:hypothetical protein BU16DRAFT_563460 [Lophium mytilinum]
MAAEELMGSPQAYRLVGCLAGTYEWEVRRDQNLFLNVKGGDGGNGGRGENGQQGGQGSRGRDATKHWDATPGGPGAPGGNGGYGTDGANGADAGNMFITVAEDDLDTLSSVFWELNGGKGGLSGTHGQPGEVELAAKEALEADGMNATATIQEL